MALVEIAGGFILGFFLGIGAAIFYLRWKMKRQLGNLEEQMGQMMEMTGDMEDMMPEADGESLENSEEE